MKKAALIVALGALATGCASSGRVVILQNPETKQTVDCRVNGTITRPYLAQENCISGYEKVGYKVVSDSDKP